MCTKSSFHTTHISSNGSDEFRLVVFALFRFLFRQRDEKWKICITHSQYIYSACNGTSMTFDFYFIEVLFVDSVGGRW